MHSFPLERVRHNSPLLAPGQQCRICLQRYLEGQHVRRLPCRHKFHKDCIDNWLLHQHATCPVDGTTYTNESVRQFREATRAARFVYMYYKGNIHIITSMGDVLLRLIKSDDPTFHH